MSDPSIRGIVHFIDDTKTYGQKGFRKRMVVLEQQKERFTNYIPVEFTHDGCDSVDSMNVGDDVEITYRLSGRKWQKDAGSEVRYFLNAEALSFQLHGGGAAGSGAAGAGAAGTSEKQINDQLAEADESDDEVPF